MLIFQCKRLCVFAVSVCLIGLPLMQPSYASVISTGQAIELGERQGRIDHINEVLARDSVQNMLVRFGVDPADASARVDALTDAELLALEQQLGDLPAGGTGIVEVVGIVAIVLIVLELLNVTNFFTEF
jgi:hypothetical protein